MKLGLLTAPFPETPLAEVATWSAANGFESLEIACWPRTTGPTRRYAGTSHIDVANLSAAQAAVASRNSSRGTTLLTMPGCRSFFQYFIATSANVFE